MAEGKKYVHVEHRKVIIDMAFRSSGPVNTGRRDRTRVRDDDTVRRMKREGMFV
jgi:hypothetical protein